MRQRASQFHVEAVAADWTMLFDDVAPATIVATEPTKMLLEARPDPVTDR
jgi:hypothetical protein